MFWIGAWLISVLTWGLYFSHQPTFEIGDDYLTTEEQIPDENDLILSNDVLILTDMWRNLTDSKLNLDRRMTYPDRRTVSVECIWLATNEMITTGPIILARFVGEKSKCIMASQRLPDPLNQSEATFITDYGSRRTKLWRDSFSTEKQDGGALG